MMPAISEDVEQPPPQRTRHRPGWIRFASNAISLLGVDSANRAATFVLYALIARYLGAVEFGQMSLALTLFYTFQVLAGAGLRTLVTREVARDRSHTGAYWVSGSLVILAASFLSIAALAAFVTAAGYSRDTALVVLLVSLGLPACALIVICDAIFQAWERMHFSALAQVPIHVAKVVAALLLLSHGYGLMSLIAVMVLSYVAILILEWSILYEWIARPDFRSTPGFTGRLVRSGSTFLGIDGLVALISSSNVILLSMFASEREIGLFSAASQLIIPLTIVYYNIVLSVFPIMCRAGQLGVPALKRCANNLIALLMALSLPAVVGLLFLAPPALALLYRRPEFAGAVPALRIIVWTLPLLSLTHVIGHVLYASQRERVTLRIVTIDLVVGLSLGFVLIGRYGLMGAALTVLLTKVVDFVLHYVSITRLFSRIAVAEPAWMPLAASACMAGYLAIANTEKLGWTILSAGLVYGAALLMVAGLAIGGPRQIKARYLEPASN